MHMICLIYCSTEHHLPTQPLQGPEELYLQWWRCLIKKMCVIPEVCVYCHLITAVCFLLHWNLWSSPRPTRSLLSNICTLLSSSGQSVSLSMELMFLHNVDRKQADNIQVCLLLLAPVSKPIPLLQVMPLRNSQWKQYCLAFLFYAALSVAQHQSSFYYLFARVAQISWACISSGTDENQD